MGLRGGEDDCMEQLRKSLLEEGREGLVKRVEGEEEGEKRCKEGGGGDAGYTCIATITLLVSGMPWHANPPSPGAPSPLTRCTLLHCSLRKSFRVSLKEIW